MSLAGPFANLAAALVAGFLIRYLFLPSELYLRVLTWMILMNIGLGLFNLLPIPPLDGSHVLQNLLPPKSALQYRAIGRYGPIVILGIVMLDNFAHTGIISRILIGPMFFLAHLFAGDNFIRMLRFLG
jgi:Zn-dependent protease